MGFSTSAGGNGAAQGAQAGMMFGPWGAAIGAGVGFIVGGLEGSRAEKEAAKARKALRAAQVEHNKLVRKETARQSAELSMQRAMTLSATANAVAYTKREGALADSDISVQNGVADAIGASAEIAHTAVTMAVDNSIGNTFREQDAKMLGFESTLQSMLNGARSMLDLRAPPTEEVQDNGLMGLVGVGASLYSQGAFSKGGAFDLSAPRSKTTVRGGSAFLGGKI